MSQSITPVNREVRLNESDLFVSKTCPKGRITYANRHFMAIAGFTESQLLDQPHNLVRHPDMPRGVYRLMWQALREGNEFFGFIKNLTADGSYYWVFANVTPDLDSDDNVRGYYSVRRKPPASAIATMEALYRKMLEIEKEGTGTEVVERSARYLTDWVSATGLDYNRLVMRLFRQGRL